MHLICFQNALDACKQAGMKVSTEKTGIASLQKPNAASKQHYATTGGDVQLPWVVFTSGGRRNSEIAKRIGKENAVLRELYPLWSQNGRFQTPQSRPFLNRSLFCSPLLVMNLES